MADIVSSAIWETLPEPARTGVRLAWEQLPPEMRPGLERWIGSGLTTPGNIRDYLRWIGASYRLAFDSGSHQIAIVGPANAGKSTLYNQLVTRKEDRAEVGPLPGTTRENQAGAAGLFTAIDTPGADDAGAAGSDLREKALAAASGADFLVIMFDGAAGINQDARDLFDLFTALGKPHVVVLNKMDLIAREERDRVLASAAERLGITAEQIIPMVATDGTNLEKVVLAITQAEPRLLLAAAEALPAYRNQIAWQRVVNTAVASAGIAFLPLPIADIAPLLALQTAMVLTIARIYGYKITLARAEELLAAFGLGMVGRTAYRQLSKAFGVPGWALSAAVTAATTITMGYASMLWFERGERPSQEALDRLVGELSAHLREQLRGLSARDLGTFRQRVQETLRRPPAISVAAVGASDLPLDEG